MRGVLDIPEELLELQAKIEQHLGSAERVFEEQLRSDLPPVDAMCEHVERYRGKMLRPTLVFLCGLAADGELDNTHDVCAAVCEMVHMATLVHDDVLDEAEIRRRGQTINAMEGNETSVILGDYLIASAYALCASLDSPVPSRLVGQASAVMCTGELLQLHNRKNWSLDEPTYFEILSRKTAALIGAACELGALSSLGYEHTEHPKTTALRSFGTNLGIAFQIQDDVLDLTGTTQSVGKSVGKDLEKGKLTYPIIHHLARASDDERAQTLSLLEQSETDPASAGEAIIELLNRTSSLEATQQCASDYVARAINSIEGVIDGPARPMLDLLASAVIERSH